LRFGIVHGAENDIKRNSDYVRQGGSVLPGVCRVFLFVRLLATSRKNCIIDVSSDMKSPLNAGSHPYPRSPDTDSKSGLDSPWRTSVFAECSLAISSQFTTWNRLSYLASSCRREIRYLFFVRFFVYLQTTGSQSISQLLRPEPS